MTDKIREYGSEVKFKTVVTKIITQGGGCVKGVRTDKGEEFPAKSIISNANVIDTLTALVDCDSIKEPYAEKFSSMQKSLSAVIVYLGLDVPAESIGMNYPLMYLDATYDQDEAFRCFASGDYSRCGLFVSNHSQLDPALAPVGKSTICAMSLDSYANWDNLTIEKYQKKKKEVAGIIVARLEKYLPGLLSHIEVLEVATPKTMERFGSAPEGAVYGFAQTVPQSSLNRLKRTTKIRGLFLAGAWTQPGCGMHGCTVSGIDAADLALRFLKK
jgi:prolycopene isomerase